MFKWFSPKVLNKELHSYFIIFVGYVVAETYHLYKDHIISSKIYDTKMPLHNIKTNLGRFITYNLKLIFLFDNTFWVSLVQSTLWGKCIQKSAFSICRSPSCGSIWTSGLGSDQYFIFCVFWRCCCTCNSVHATNALKGQIWSIFNRDSLLHNQLCSKV